jgi:hypothetical protein
VPPYRVFDAGAFHVGFGIAAPSDDETTEFSVEGVARNGRAPFRHSLAVTLYGDSLVGRTPLSLEAEEAFTSLLAGLVESGPWILERSATGLREADLNVFSKLGKQGLE